MKLQVGVKLLIKNRQERYLLIQRSEPLPDGTGIKWDIPGGRINTSEKLEQALAREVLEEVGIKLDRPVRLLSAQDIIIPDVNLHVVRLTYITVLAKEIELGQEHQNFKWVTLNDAVKLNVDTYLRVVLQSLLQTETSFC